jgi:hypothetical protein
VWDHSTFSTNPGRLLDGDIAASAGTNWRVRRHGRVGRARGRMCRCRSPR